jgi:hypothetical protein
MKKFIGEIRVHDPNLMTDIVHALEAGPQSGRMYEVSMFEGSTFDPCSKNVSDSAYLLKIFINENV